jgi:hypothetical protein
MRRSPKLAASRLLLAVAVMLGAVPTATMAQVADAPQVVRFHGGGYDRAEALAVDATRNVYIAGSVDSDSTGTFAVVKLSPQGSVLWVGRYSGSRGGVGGSALAVTTDSAGNVYAAGWTGDGVIFNNNIDYLVVAFGPDGVERWAQRYDGPASGFDQATEIAVDAAGNVYVSGFSYGQNQNQAYDWTTHKYSPSGTLLWERRLSGPGTNDDRVADLMLAPDGNLVLTGFTKNTGDGLTNDLETVTYDPAGNVVWQRRWTDTAASHETPFDLDIDASGRIAITGTTAENASPYAVPGPVTLRYDRAGTLLQVIREGGASVDADGAGNLVLAGFFFEPSGISSVARYDTAGARVWSTPLTVNAEDALSGLTVRADSAGAVTLAGTIRDIFVHNDDYLTVRYAADGRELWRYRFNGPVGGDDRLAGLAIDGADNAVVTGTSWNGYLSYKGTADDIVTLRFPAAAAPALVAPSNLTATGVSTSQIRLTWRDNAGTEDGFRIERCQGVGCTGFVQIAIVGHDVTVYTDSGLARNTQYSYRVQAFDGDQVSVFSNTATGKTRHR